MLRCNDRNSFAAMTAPRVATRANLLFHSHRHKILNNRAFAPQ
jgi:hypothetical protein